jgi:GNAT superfamily N-acetyltransferase
VTIPFTIRPAGAADLERIWDIRYANDVAGAESIPARGPVPPYLRHVLATGTLLVAETARGLAGYAGAVTRGEVAFLTDLFVDPGAHSGSIGQSLLRAILPSNKSLTTLASVDPRAIALYTRAGMSPRWPNMLLEIAVERLKPRSPVDAESEEIAPNDGRLLALDRETSGRHRPEDLAYFVADEHGVALRFYRGAKTLGFGIVRFGAGRLWHPEAVTIGPIGAVDSQTAGPCVLAAMDYAAARGSYLEIAVPGPHPAFPPLLAAGFRLVYVETYCAADIRLIDPERYIGSGGDFF